MTKFYQLGRMSVTYAPALARGLRTGARKDPTTTDSVRLVARQVDDLRRQLANSNKRLSATETICYDVQKTRGLLGSVGLVASAIFLGFSTYDPTIEPSYPRELAPL